MVAMKEKSSISGAVGGFAALGLSAAYVASYLVTVQPIAGPTIFGQSVLGRLPHGMKIPLEPKYELGEYKATQVMFSPLLWLDRRVRTEHWTYTETNHFDLVRCAYEVELERRWKSASNTAANK